MFRANENWDVNGAEVAYIEKHMAKLNGFNLTSTDAQIVFYTMQNDGDANLKIKCVIAKSSTRYTVFVNSMKIKKSFDGYDYEVWGKNLYHSDFDTAPKSLFGAMESISEFLNQEFVALNAVKKERNVAHNATSRIQPIHC